MRQMARRLARTVVMLLLTAVAFCGTWGRAAQAAGAAQTREFSDYAVAAEHPASKGVVADLAAMCQPAALQAVVARLEIKVTIQELPREESPGPFLHGGVAFKPAGKDLPAYCQITGSFVTNPKSGKTANFLATTAAEVSHLWECAQRLATSRTAATGAVVAEIPPCCELAKAADKLASSSNPARAFRVARRSTESNDYEHFNSGISTGAAGRIAADRLDRPTRLSHTAARICAGFVG